MSPGFRRAVAGQGAAAAVQLLVTLSLLSSLVKTQVSPREQRQGTGHAGVAERPRCRCEWPAGDQEPHRLVRETSVKRGGRGDTTRVVMVYGRGRW